MTDLQFAIIITVAACIYFGIPVPGPHPDHLTYDFFASLFVVIAVAYVWIYIILGVFF